jgi:hypothetical protein
MIWMMNSLKRKINIGSNNVFEMKINITVDKREQE